MLVCYPSCKKNKNLLISSIESFQRHNPKITFAIFNNNEYSKSDLKDIKKHCQKLLVFDISFWMDIFRDCQTLHSQRNCYIRLLMPRVFQKFDKRVSQIIYCDEDCYCIGHIDKFWRYYFKNDVIGFKDAYNISFENGILTVPRCHSYEGLLITSESPYINSGLLKFKTSFDIRYLLSSMNFYIVSHCCGISALHDQTLINTLEHNMIDFEIDHKNNSNRYVILTIAKQFEHFNIAHTYGYRNDMKRFTKEMHKMDIDKDLIERVN